MKRQWRLHRQTIQRPDASRRWDRACQSILQWALEAEPDPAPMLRRSAMRVAAYVRVSSPGQVKLETIEHQLETIHRYVRDKG